jgi:hypothetical protein
VDGQVVPIDVDLIAKITGFLPSGVKPEDYLDNKARDKEIAEEVKAQFRTNRGTRGIIIKDINDPATKFSTNLMACKLLRKCRKEEAPTGVIEVVVQCAKGVVLSWAPYLLNQFLIDCRDAQDNGTKFHYSWLLILIALVGWKEPKFSSFLDRKGKCCATWYETLWQEKDPKNQQVNNTVFSMFLEDMQQKTTNVWRIPIEVVQENEGIANFKASRHHLWIQARRDPKKKWLEMRYCTSREEVDWIVKDWPVQWKVPVT